MSTMQIKNNDLPVDENTQQQEKSESWKGKSKDFALGYKVFIWLLKNLGVPAGYFLLIFVAFYYFLFDRPAIKASMFYFQEIHKQNWLTARLNTYRGFYKIGQVLLDKVAALANFTNRFTFSFDGEHHLRDMAEENNGGVLLSAHVVGG